MKVKGRKWVKELKKKKNASTTAMKYKRRFTTRRATIEKGKNSNKTYAVLTAYSNNTQDDNTRSLMLHSCARQRGSGKKREKKARREKENQIESPRRKVKTPKEKTM